ncbi:hypothetical protein EHP00_1748 [Ecytonucleospora hepatopenaei]|uniref:Uncharacterized protein n=1 Tax=Ecytonucleospora hepatopenaei TaxID=646526 RepID=A0A1W0E6W0_9MICR|nr:hypothetical protein EHP00_1748 [Ecytonucleospora hepatopenaei]
MSEVKTKTFKVCFEEQKKDGIVESSDVLSYLQSIMKVRNSKVLAEKELTFKDNESSIEILCKKNDVIKRNMKLYIKRYLRSKQLYPYIKVAGEENNKIVLKYRNPVTDEE